jgi:anti-anti-sigma factor
LTSYSPLRYNHAMTNAEVGCEEARAAKLLQWSFTQSGADVTVVLAGELDLSTADRLGAFLREVAAERRPRILAVDVAKLSFLDSTGIHCLFDAAQAAAKAGGALVLRRPSPRIVRILEICGVDDVLLREPDGDASGDR